MSKNSNSIYKRSKSFREKCKIVHNNKYDYSNTIYKNVDEKIEIICPIHGSFIQSPRTHLYKKGGCNKCAVYRSKIVNTKTLEQFIHEARHHHDDRYDYSQVEYINAHSPVEIICPTHGSFFQIASVHTTKGHGCKKCALRMSLDEFIEKSNIVHQNIYKYDEVNYRGGKSKINILCPHHGIFSQKAESHLAGMGCPTCAGNIKSNTFEFTNKAKLIHNDKYGYSEVEYINALTKVKIVCPEHGVFNQTPNSHLCGTACPKCASSYSYDTVEFIKRAKLMHNDKYDYSLVDYTNGKVEVCITCPNHGVFFQKPRDHLQGCGCSKCVKKPYSKIAVDWLDSISKQNNIFIQHAGNVGEYHILQTRYHADGYCSETNTIYEFYGDYFHGNLNIFKPHEHCHPFDRTVTAVELYNKTMIREEKLKYLGYNLVTIWESDFKTQI